jgi:hypothetical protein
MNDRELLEFAAKAAGIKYDAEASKPHPRSGVFWGLWLVIDGEPSVYERRYWDPLTDDGDAMRLLVQLGFLVNVVLGPAGWTDAGEKFENEWREPHKRNPLAATRRAIVRAAAEIGKSL